MAALEVTSNSNATRVVYLIVASVFVSLLAVEAIGRIFLLLRPSYEAIPYQPHPVVGWTQVPNLRWTWAGLYWYASDYSVGVQANSLGFRGPETKPQKPDGTVRIALLGDSMVAALQVPLDKTAGQLLQAGLSETAPPGVRFEVLNFGIGAFGVGQYLLTWEEYASRFAPDHTFAFVAAFHMNRTVTAAEPGSFLGTRAKSLRVRPTFRLENGALIREPAKDFAE